MRNLIDAIHTLVQNPVTELKEFYKSKNRANSMGDALEEYVKDLFADTLTENNEAKLQDEIQPQRKDAQH